MGRTLLVVALVVSSGFLGNRLNPEAYRMKKVAVLGFSGANGVLTLSGPLAVLQSGNSWGRDVLDGITPGAVDDLKMGLDAELVPPADVQKAAAFSRFTVEKPGGLMGGYAAMGLKMPDGKDDTAAIAALEKELGADGVLLFSMTFSVVADHEQQVGEAQMFVLAWGPDGKSYGTEVFRARSLPVPGTLNGVAANVVGGVAKAVAVDLAQDAAIESLHSFIRTWRIKRLTP